MWKVAVLLVVLAGISAYADPSLTYPELARGNSRIVSGWEATPGQLPHQLSIRMINPVGSVSSCGASIIHDEWALTAAHCTAGRESFVIRAGTVNLTRPYYMFETTEFYNHPYYNEAIPGIVQPNDVGVMKFPFKLKFNELVQPIRIQRSEDKDKNYYGVRMTASGWGRTWTNGVAPENLNWVFLRGVTNLFCLFSFGGSSIIQPSTICASGYNDTTQSTCQGDSGGPLTVVERDGKPTLVGVTSFVSALGCHVDLPAGFCRGGYYHNWYKEITGVDFDWDWEKPEPEEPEPEEPEPEEPEPEEPEPEEPEPEEPEPEEPEPEEPEPEEPEPEEPEPEEPEPEEPEPEEPEPEEPEPEEPEPEEPEPEEPEPEEPEPEEPEPEEPEPEEPEPEEPEPEEPEPEEPEPEEPEPEEPEPEEPEPEEPEPEEPEPEEPEPEEPEPEEPEPEEPEPEEPEPEEPEPEEPEPEEPEPEEPEPEEPEPEEPEPEEPEPEEPEPEEPEPEEPEPEEPEPEEPEPEEPEPEEPEPEEPEPEEPEPEEPEPEEPEPEEPEQPEQELESRL